MLRYRVFSKHFYTNMINCVLMTVRRCQNCKELFNDKKNENVWDIACILTVGWSTMVEPDDRRYCSDCVKD